MNTILSGVVDDTYTTKSPSSETGLRKGSLQFMKHHNCSGQDSFLRIWIFYTKYEG